MRVTSLLCLARAFPPADSSSLAIHYREPHDHVVTISRRFMMSSQLKTNTGVLLGLLCLLLFLHCPGEAL